MTTRGITERLEPCNPDDETQNLTMEMQSPPEDQSSAYLGWAGNTYTMVESSDPVENGFYLASKALPLPVRAQMGGKWSGPLQSEEVLDDAFRDGRIGNILYQRAPLRPLEIGQVRIYFLGTGQGAFVIIDGHNWEHPIVLDAGTIEDRDNDRVIGVDDAIRVAHEIFDGRSPNVFISHPDIDHYNLIPSLFPADGTLFPENLVLGGLGTTGYSAAFRRWLTQTGIAALSEIRVNDLGQVSGRWATGFLRGQEEAVDNPLVPRTRLVNPGPSTPTVELEYVTSDPESADANGRSVVMNLRVGDAFSATFMANATGPVEQAVQQAFDDRDTLRIAGGVLEGSHHGASTHGSNSDAFGAFAQPGAVVFTTGATNYAHPRAQAAASYLPHVATLGETHQACYWDDDEDEPDVHDSADAMFSTMETGTVAFTITAPGAVGRSPATSNDGVNTSNDTWVDVYVGGNEDAADVTIDVNRLLGNAGHSI